MYTSQQAVMALLDELGAQDFATIVLECKIQATDSPDENAIRRLLANLLDEGVLFSDGVVFSSHSDEIAHGNLVHCVDFLKKAFE
ncbi:hypothetical protein [Undibacterium flavidum]|uniref:TubC N-terminal docking domain-containing protein n=1 Tax=Undibacterium flavidum TaxID=2762297 RepID=A0ABR6YCI5_9BURK|nr:hypothetical protein [Undibacterium flavidum]MBC3874253.1 hypothetical protein [Undibacterium flavidum]